MLWTEGAAFFLTKPQMQVQWAGKCISCCPDEETEHCLWDLPYVCHADVSANDVFPHCPAPLSSLYQYLDPIALILYPCYLSHYQLLPLFPAGLGPEPRGFSPCSTCPSCLDLADNLFVMQPANCLADFSMGFPLGDSADLDIYIPHCLISRPC